MSNVVATLSSQTGIGSDQVRRGLGALLSFLKAHLGDETFSRIRAAVPQVGEIVDAHEASEAPSAGGGLIAAVTEFASKFLGTEGLDVSKLLASLSAAGFSVEQVRTFIPKALEYLEAHLPPELIDRIKASVLGGSATAEAPAE
jgi:hypothetical protein